jgi:hypothetical protein
MFNIEASIQNELIGIVNIRSTNHIVILRFFDTENVFDEILLLACLESTER